MTLSALGYEISFQVVGLLWINSLSQKVNEALPFEIEALYTQSVVMNFVSLHVNIKVTSQRLYVPKKIHLSNSELSSVWILLLDSIEWHCKNKINKIQERLEIFQIAAE